MAVARKRHTQRDSSSVLVASDLHGYPDHDMLVKAVRRHRPDTVVLAGDVISADVFSRWTRYQDSSYAEEITRVRHTVQVMASLVDKVILVEGNHEARVYRWAWNHGGSTLSEADRGMVYNTLPLHIIAAGIDNVVVATDTYPFVTSYGTVYDKTFECRFIANLGDAYVGHPSFSLKGPSKSALRFYEWLDNWRLPLGLPEPFAVIMGHTHRLSMAYILGGHKVIAESGAMMHPKVVSYVFEQGGRGGPEPPVLGYVTFQQADGKTDVGSLQLHLI